MLITRIFNKEQARYSEDYILPEFALTGQNIHFAGSIEVHNPKGVTLGSNVILGDKLYLDAWGAIIIGDNVSIGREVTIFTTENNYLLTSGKPISPLYTKPVMVEENVMIQLNSTLCPGIKVGKGSVIKAGSVIFDNIPPFSVVEGNPAKVVGKVATSTKSIINNFQKLSDLDSQNMCFIFSTGRSGSKSIVDTLNQIPSVFALHEPKFGLIKLSAEKLVGARATQSLKEEFVDFFMPNSTIPEDKEFYIESDQKLAAFIPWLRELFPSAKFVWIYRSPYGFIKSSAARGWFKEESRFRQTALENLALYPEERSQGLRLGGDVLGEIPEEKWMALSVLERNAWYWAFWNRMIFDHFQSLPDDCTFTVQLENLDSTLNKLLSFLGIAGGSNLQMLKTNKIKAKDSKRLESDAYEELEIERAVNAFCQKDYELFQTYTRR